MRVRCLEPLSRRRMRGSYLRRGYLERFSGQCTSQLQRFAIVRRAYILKLRRDMIKLDISLKRGVDSDNPDGQAHGITNAHDCLVKAQEQYSWRSCSHRPTGYAPHAAAPPHRACRLHFTSGDCHHDVLAASHAASSMPALFRKP